MKSRLWNIIVCVAYAMLFGAVALAVVRAIQWGVIG